MKARRLNHRLVLSIPHLELLLHPPSILHLFILSIIRHEIEGSGCPRSASITKGTRLLLLLLSLGLLLEALNGSFDISQFLISSFSGLIVLNSEAT